MPLLRKENYCDIPPAGKFRRFVETEIPGRRSGLAVEVEEPLHGIKQAVRRSFAGFFAKCFQRWVQQFVDDPVDAVLDRLSILFAQVLKLG